MGANHLNAVFYADSYHPIQAGSIDGTDIVPHDNAVYRAVLCFAAGLYDPFGDPKVISDPYCTLFVARLSHQTSEETLRKAMSAHGRVKNLRLVRDIVTGASRGYAFVEYESEREMRRAYMDAHHSIIDDSEVIVDYNRQQLMPGWIPRRLGGGLGGKKESGQLRFGGRERPFRAPLRPIPNEDLKRLGISPPPEGRFLSRFQVPSPPRSGKCMEMEDLPTKHRQYTEREDTPTRGQSNRPAINREDPYLKHRRPKDREDTPPKWREDSHKRRWGSEDRDDTLSKGREDSHLRHRRFEGMEGAPPMWREDSHWRHQRSEDREDTPTKWKSSYTIRGESHHRSVAMEDSITRCPTGGAHSLHKHDWHHTERPHRRKNRSPS